MADRLVVKPPKWGFFSAIPKTAVIEVGPRLPIYRVDSSIKPGEDAARDVYLDGEKIGFVQQYTHTTTAPLYRGSRVVRPTGRPTTWVINGCDFWNDYRQMNEAVYHLVDDHLRKTKGKR